MNDKKIIFRVDASIQIGTGHVMRCLTLADALSESGAEVQFICRKHTGNLIMYIQSKGYIVHTLETPKTTSPTVIQTKCEMELQLYHANWLGVSQEKDSQESKPIMQNFQPDWLVVDHYSINKVWQTELKGTYQKLMVIDDLADREHQCDLLLDQTYGRLSQDYHGLVPANCQMLLGSQYALLRPEFAKWREFSLKRRAVQSQFKKLLITMGGVDPDNVTSRVLDVLKTCDLSKDLEIMVVMGATAPHLDTVKNQAEGMPYKTKVKVNVDNMAEIMANADLAIGASGATTWERCCLGLPSIQIVLAKNQELIAQNLQKKNISKVINDVSQLCPALASVERKLKIYTKKSSEILEGLGIKLVVKALL